MAIRVCKFQSGNSTGWGVVEGSMIRPVEAAHISDFFGEKFRTLKSAGTPIDLSSVQILCPVEYPAAVICQGENYADHIREFGGNVAKKHNTFFIKATSSLTSAAGSVKKPSFVQLLDYEAEIALVIAKDISGAAVVTNENIHEYIAGVTLANDISARDIQIPQGQWFKGKSYRTFCPVGPFVVIMERADFASLPSCEFSLSVNGNLRQHAAFTDMIHFPAETLTELSGLMDLHAGDLVLTGTPKGVAVKSPSASKRRLLSILFSETKLMKMFIKIQKKKPEYLQPGDRIEAILRSTDGVIDAGVMHLEIVGG